MSDMHYGSTGVDYDLLDRHLEIVEDTPNFYMATNGDHIDNFNSVIHSSGMTENPISPQEQAIIFMSRLLELDRQSKIAVLGQGNHDDFMGVSGMDFYQSFMADFSAPIFDQGGILNIVTPGQNYRMVMNHTYWGRSKLNVTNAPKRMLEYEGGGNCDIAWVGHTHQSSYEHLERAGKDVVAVVSGTYKQNDPWAAKRGIGGRGQEPGLAIMLWPNERRMECFKDIEVAQQVMAAWVFEKEHVKSKGNSRKGRL